MKLLKSTRVRAMSVLAVLPLLTACAAVLGLEEAEVTETTAETGGSGGKGGTGPGGAGAANALGGTVTAAGAFGKGGGDLGGALTLGGSVGKGGAAGKSGGLGAGGVQPGGATGMGGSVPPPMGGTGGASCLNTDPSVCVGASSVRYCHNGTPRTVTCSTRCSEAGFASGSGMCSDTICMCGDALDDVCAAGTYVYCECGAREGTPCSQAAQLAAYQLCYQHDPSYEPALRCMAPFAQDATLDCEEVSLSCF